MASQGSGPRRTLSAVALVIGVLGGTVTGGVPASAMGANASQDQLEAEVLRLTNAARSHSQNCGGKEYRATRPVKWNARLAEAADEHSTDMSDRDYFSHTSPDGRSPFDRIRAAGYSYRAAGENIAAGVALSDAEAVVQAWLDSPGHCKVLMNPKYRDLGVGRVEGSGKWGVYWTQNFGRR